MRAALGHNRQHHHGRVGAQYHTTKRALEALSDCLRMELKAFGINVVSPAASEAERPSIAAEKVRAVSGTGSYARRATPLPLPSSPNPLSGARPHRS